MTYMTNLLATTDLILYLGEQDKYGRILTKVTTTEGLDVSEDLIKRNLVFPYKGDTKMTLKQQADFCLSTSPVVWAI